MYTVTVGDWGVPEKASLTPFTLETPSAGSQKNQATMHDCTVSSVLPATGSTLYDDAYMPWQNSSTV